MGGISSDRARSGIESSSNLPLICVCMKQIMRADTGFRQTDSDALPRQEELNFGPNPSDLSALQLGLDLKASIYAGRARVMAFTMAPFSGERLLRDALAAGADDVLRLWGRDWPDFFTSQLDGSAGVTQWVAERTAEVLSDMNPSLVLAGEKGGEGGHECFGALLAQKLGASFAHRVISVSMIETEWQLVVRVEKGYGQKVRFTGPVVLTVSSSLPTPGYASLPDWLESRKGEVPCMAPAGTLPSTTPAVEIRMPLPRVKRHQTPESILTAEERIQAMVAIESGEGGRIVTGGSPQSQAAEIADALRGHGYL